MGSLREFLAEQAEKLKDEPSRAAAVRDEWVAAVDRLIARIRGWIDEADPDRVLAVEERTVAIREERIGSYEIHGLTIALGVRSVRVEPIARNVMGPLEETGAFRVVRVFGRVDMTNGLEKYMIFRKVMDHEGPWIIVKQDGYPTRPFDRASFEAALQDLLG